MHRADGLTNVIFEQELAARVVADSGNNPLYRAAIAEPEENILGCANSRT